MNPPDYLPNSYRTRKIRFGWDRHEIVDPPIADLLFYPDFMSGAGWVGSVAQVSDMQKSGLAPLDDTPETYDGIYAQNGTTNDLVFDFPTFVPGKERMHIALAGSACQNGVVAAIPNSTSMELTITSSTIPVVWKRTFDTPRGGVIAGAEWDFEQSELNLEGIDLETVQVRIRPYNLGGALPSGIFISYFHFRFNAINP
jgi:hypothetical protein